MLPAGTLREVIVIEHAIEHRNELGEVAQVTWRELARRRASVEQQLGSEAQQMHQTGARAAFQVRTRYVPGMTTGMRIRWESCEDRLLYISGVVEVVKRTEHLLNAEER
jgi:head-tail adaptor